jgi:stearoyl-CoA desaturase (delta-9 desaturase)
MPVYVTHKLLGYPFWQAFYMNTLRYVLSLHITWCTNSVAHIGSWKPYDKTIAASDSMINGTLTFGEGWHNFHHTFPWDYKVSELPLYRHNFSIAFIDFFAWLGWVTDLKIASDDLIRKRVLRTGDGSHPFSIEEAKKMKLNEDYLNNNCEKMKQNEDIKESEVFWGIGKHPVIF